MQFNVQERLLLLSSLSTVAGNLATLRIVRDLQLELGLSEEEHTASNLREKDGRVFWDENKIPPKEISIGPAGLDAALSMFEKMDETKTLTIEYLPLYERLLKSKHETTPKLHEAGAPGA